MEIYPLMMVLLVASRCMAARDDNLLDGCPDRNDECHDEDTKDLCLGEYTEGFASTKRKPSNSFDDVFTFNAECRQTCTKYFRENKDKLSKDENAFVSAIGGAASTVFMDLFSYRHEICNLTQGWTRTAIENLMQTNANAYIATKSREVPRLTRTGYKVEKLPEEVFQKIHRIYSKSIFRPIRADNLVEGVEVWRHIDTKGGRPTVKDAAPSILATELTAKEERTIAELLRPHAEKFLNSEVSLEMSVFTGVRKNMQPARYLPRVHVGDQSFSGLVAIKHDKSPTAPSRSQCIKGPFCSSCHFDHSKQTVDYIVSGIMHISDRLDNPWPIQVMDHSGRVSDIRLTKGEILWFESVKTPTARNMPVEGHFSDDITLHFRRKKKQEKHTEL